MLRVHTVDDLAIVSCRDNKVVWEVIEKLRNKVVSPQLSRLIWKGFVRVVNHTDRTLYVSIPNPAGHLRKTNDVWFNVYEPTTRSFYQFRFLGNKWCVLFNRNHWCPLLIQS